MPFGKRPDESISEFVKRRQKTRRREPTKLYNLKTRKAPGLRPPYGETVDIIGRLPLPADVKGPIVNNALSMEKTQHRDFTRHQKKFKLRAKSKNLLKKTQELWRLRDLNVERGEYFSGDIPNYAKKQQKAARDLFNSLDDHPAEQKKFVSALSEDPHLKMFDFVKNNWKDIKKYIYAKRDGNNTYFVDDDLVRMIYNIYVSVDEELPTKFDFGVLVRKVDAFFWQEHYGN
tara:strand:+ start:9692 stop:10384 length:693 start_codon:yes stop_codon:yes gene_type:complete